MSDTHPYELYKPFWCGELGKHLMPISVEHADSICQDVQLYWTLGSGRSQPYWRQDHTTPEEYRRILMGAEEDWKFHPARWLEHINAIEVDIGRPEYESDE